MQDIKIEILNGTNWYIIGEGQFTRRFGPLRGYVRRVADTPLAYEGVLEVTNTSKTHFYTPVKDQMYTESTDAEVCRKIENQMKAEIRSWQTET